MIGGRPDSASGQGPGPDDRGVSEVVAFILVFAIILGSVGLLYTTTFDAMLDYQETERETNAVRAMDSLTDNFNDVLRNDGVNERFGELSVREGTVSFADSGTRIDITLGGKHGDEPLGTNGERRFAGYGDGVTAELGEFAYESDDGKIAYEGGGLVRSDETGNAVLREPQLRCNPERNTAVISLVTVSAEDRSVRSSNSLGVEMVVQNRTSVVYTDVDNVTISIDETEYETAWNDVFSGDWDSGDDLEGVCEPEGSDLERVVVTLVDVDIEFR